MVLLCVAHGTNTFGYLERSGRFGVNILRQEQQELGAYFAKRPEDRQGDMKYSYSTGESSVPILDGSMVFLNCQVAGAHVYGDHTVYLGSVTEIRRNEPGDPLLFFRSTWYNPGK